MRIFYFFMHLVCASLSLCVADLRAGEYVCELDEKVSESLFPMAHSATICEAQNGDLLCAFFGGVGEKSSDTSIFLAIKPKGKSEWIKPIEVANALEKDGKRFASWNPVLYVEPSGKIHLYYKLGDSPRTWEGYVKYSSDNGKSWSEQKKLGDGLIGPAKNKPILFDGKLIMPSSREFHSSFGWTSHFEILQDGKLREVKVPKSIFCGLIQPAILKVEDGSLVAFMRSRVGKVYYSTSKDGEIWQEAKPTNIDNPNSGLDAICLKNGDIMLICNPTKEGRQKLSIFVSRDLQNWTEIFTKESQYSLEYPSIIQTQNGDIHAVFSSRNSTNGVISHIQLIEK